MHIKKMPNGQRVVTKITPEDIVGGKICWPSDDASTGLSALVAIGPFACQGINTLTHLYLPAGIKIIHVGAFQGCQQLRTIYCPLTLETIEADAFAACKGVKRLWLNDKLGSIARGNFIDLNMAHIFVERSINKIYDNGKTLLHMVARDKNLNLMTTLTDKACIQKTVQHVAAKCDTRNIRYDWHTLTQQYTPDLRLLDRTTTGPELTPLETLFDSYTTRERAHQHEALSAFLLQYRQALLDIHGSTVCQKAMIQLAKRLNLNANDVSKGLLISPPDYTPYRPRALTPAYAYESQPTPETHPDLFRVAVRGYAPASSSKSSKSSKKTIPPP